MNLPGGWAIIGSFHGLRIFTSEKKPRFRAKDGDLWAIQVWHPEKRGFIFSHRGFKPKFIR